MAGASDRRHRGLAGRRGRTRARPGDPSLTQAVVSPAGLRLL